MAERRIVVTLGPSLPLDEARALLPRAQYRPPVRAGEVLHLGLGSGDVLLVLDGVFLQSRAVRHKELLDLVGAGVRVLGASSMGALRAAELDDFGVRGVGSVYRAYRRGGIEGDDEVALVHADADAGFRPLTWALVDLRAAASTCRTEGVLSAAEADAVVATAAALPFTARSTAAVTAELVASARDRFRRRCPRPGGWAKAADARAALRVTAAVAGRPPGPVPMIASVTTSHLHAWRHVPGWSAPGITAREAFLAVAVHRPGFADVFARAAGECLLACAIGADPTDPTATGRLDWPELVAELAPRLTGMGLWDGGPHRPAGTAPEVLLRPAEQTLPAADRAVRHATRMWCAANRFDWLAPLLARIEPPAGVRRRDGVDAPAELRAWLARVGVARRAEILPAVRAHGALTLRQLGGPVAIDITGTGTPSGREPT